MIIRREHDHPPNSAMCTKERVMSTMRKRAREELTSINRIYDDALQQYESGAILPARRRKVREKERRLTTLFDRFNNGELSLDDFLEAVKHQTEF